MAMDIAAAVNAELLDLQAAGCDLLQLDEPAMTRYHEKVFDYGAAALDRCLEGVTVPVIVHLCYGYPGGASLQHQYTYPELLDRLMETRIAGFTVEFARSTYDPAILKPYRERLFMFGCIDPGNTPAPTVDDGEAPHRRRARLSRSGAGDAVARLRADDHQPRPRARKAQGHGAAATGFCGRGCDIRQSESELVRAGVDHRPQFRAVAHALHLRREAALAA